MQRPEKRLSLEWRVLPDGKAALIFDAASWMTLDEIATARRTDVQSLVTERVCSLLGPLFRM